jgi:hypothetical protein
MRKIKLALFHPAVINISITLSSGSTIGLLSYFAALGVRTACYAKSRVLDKKSIIPLSVD